MATWLSVTRIPSDNWGPLPPHASAPPRGPAWRWVERVLVLVGIVCLGYYGYVSAEAAIYQAYETRALNEILSTAPASPAPVTTVRTKVHREPLPGSTIGRLEIPRLGVSAIVRAGSDARTLQLAIGHVPGTALPGERGNIALAAHRDTFFRRLGEIRADDEVRVVTRDGTFTYRVDATRIVKPSDIWVLDPTDQPALTLITCYPFRYIGHAPQRFVVRARMVPGQAT